MIMYNKVKICLVGTSLSYVQVSLNDLLLKRGCSEEKSRNTYNDKM